MSQSRITGVTLSLKVGDMNYGSGSERLLSLKSDNPDGPPLEGFDELVDQVLDMNEQAWQLIQSSRYSGGVINQEEYSRLISGGRKRTQKVRTFLKELSNEPTAE